MMKSLDAICAKLKQQTHSATDDNNEFVLSENNDLSEPGTPISNQNRNKRKNFQPKLCRTSDSNLLASTVSEEVSKEEKQEDKPDTPVSVIEQQQDDDDEGSLQDYPLNMQNPVTFLLGPGHNQLEDDEDLSGKEFDTVSGGSSGENPEDTKELKTPISAVNAITHANPSLEHYIVRFVGTDCGFDQCRMATGNREHFHCKQCDWRLFTKKEEMLRHYKWHRKREESLVHGFMRYSASDSCGIYFRNCPHNLRQTHYHCLQKECDKVYISTSDVQMHANSHRKAAHIAREGFQRFKASEDCKYHDCPFRDPKHRTTHFHCLRQGCTHSFKNKSDMDKHKAHHLRDEQLIRDGFKKFMKTESCAYPACAFARVVNHIHCIRPGCDYVLHSTGQMYSHKRKHEKQEKRCAELLMGSNPKPIIPQMSVPYNPLLNPAALAAAVLQAQANTNVHHASVINGNSNLQPIKDTPKSEPKRMVESSGDGLKLKIKQFDPQHKNFVHTSAIGGRPNHEMQSNDSTAIEDVSRGIDLNMLQQPLNLMTSIETDDEQETTMTLTNGKDHEQWKKYMTRFTANDRCYPHCVLMYKDHYHCTAGDGCTMTFRSKEGVREHGKHHQMLEQATDNYRIVDINEPCSIERCPYDRKERHFHCAAVNCTEVIGSSEPIFRRLEHHKVHEYAHQFTATSLPSIFNESPNSSAGGSPSSQNGSEVRRKRGRPPKYQQAIDFNTPQINSEFMLGTFKLSRPSAPSLPTQPQPSRRGRPRTVSSPRHPGPLSPSMTAAAVNTSLAMMSMLPGYTPVSRGPAEPQLKPEFDGFATFMPSEVCVDDSCPYKFQMHYHCKATRCFYATVMSDLLESHRNDFHENLEIPEGFACYDRNYNCKFSSCASNGNSRHFHCMRQNCGQSFLKVNNLASHGCNQTQSLVINERSDNNEEKTVKTSGIYFPASKDDDVKLAIKGRPYTIDQHCGRPFCKLKRRIHYHCSTCAQGFSNVGRLLPHLQKHGITLQPQEAAAALIGAYPNTNISMAPMTMSEQKPSIQQPDSPLTRVGDGDDNEKKGQQRKIKFHMFQPELLKFTTDGRKLFAPPTEINQLETVEPIPGPALKKFKFVDCTQETVDAVNRAEVQFFSQPEPIPEGFGRFSQEMDCGISGCMFSSLHPVHYHCLRAGCGYAIWDKSKLMAHSRDHDNPNMEIRPKINPQVICTLPTCEYLSRGPHLHCQKCQFWAVDPTKMALHLKQHAKLDHMAAMGFEKVSPNGSILCHHNSCPFTSQAHYHCLHCSFIAVNGNQMAMHKESVHSS